MAQLSLPLGLGHLDFGKWFYGLVAAFVSGASGAVYAGISVAAVDNNHFNLYTRDFWLVILSTFVLGGMIPFFAYLHTSPLPNWKTVTTTTQTLDSGPPQVKKTVVEIHTEQVEPPNDGH